MDTAIDRRALIRDLEESFLLTGGGELRGSWSGPASISGTGMPMH